MCSASFWLGLVGTVLQLGGLVVAVAQLNDTWKSQPGEHQPLLLRAAEPALARVRALVGFLSGKSRSAIVHVPPAKVTVSAPTPTVTATRGLDPTQPVADQMAQLKREVDEGRAVADSARDQGLKNFAALNDLPTKHREVRAAAVDDVRAQAARTVPLALAGLLVAALGTALQLTGLIFGHNCH